MAIKVYGADWCGDTKHTLAQLDSLGVVYEYVNLDRDEQAAAWVKKQNWGKECKPTVEIDGQVLFVPSNRELISALREKGLMA